MIDIIGTDITIEFQVKHAEINFCRSFVDS